MGYENKTRVWVDSGNYDVFDKRTARQMSDKEVTGVNHGSVGQWLTAAVLMVGLTGFWYRYFPLSHMELF